MDIRAAVQNAALKYGVDPALALAVAQQESGLNPNAVSSAGAIGVMQLMPGTARDLGADPRDPAQNIDAGVRYLSQLLGQFGGDPSLALAAYNSGPGTVQRYGGIPPYPETQSYVSKILAQLGLDTAPTWSSDDAGQWDVTEQALTADIPSGYVYAAAAAVAIAALFVLRD